MCCFGGEICVGVVLNSRRYAWTVRFSWYDSNAEQCQAVVYRFLRVVFGVTSSPFLLNGTVKHHLDRYAKEKKADTDKLNDDFYVDDLVSGCQTVSLGKELYTKSKSIMHDAGLDLRKWVTNDPELRNYISLAMEVSKGNMPVEVDDLTYFEAASTNIDSPAKTVLGLSWDTTSDDFVFRFDNLVNKCLNMTLTKRNILSVSASIFDSLDMLAPITAKLKSLFQLLCMDKLDWHDLIPKEIEEIWKKLVASLKMLKEVR